MKKFAEYVSVDEIDARVAEIDAELKTENANVEELSAEFDGLKARSSPTNPRRPYCVPP